MEAERHLKDIKQDKVKTKTQENEHNNRFRALYIVLSLFLLVGVSIAYAALAVNLGIPINGIKEIERPDWNIEFQNLKVVTGSVNAVRPATILDSKTDIVYSVRLNNPGEFYGFIVDVVNTGSMDAKLYDIISTKLNSTQLRYLNYSVRYIDNSEIKINDTLAGEHHFTNDGESTDIVWTDEGTVERQYFDGIVCVCKCCGKAFVRYSNENRRQYCGDSECARKRARERQKRSRENNKVKTQQKSVNNTKKVR